MYFLGIGEHNNTYVYEHMCFSILQYKVPCGVNNTVTVQAFYLNIFENETVFSFSVNSTSVSTIHILNKYNCDILQIFILQSVPLLTTQRYRYNHLTTLGIDIHLICLSVSEEGGAIVVVIVWQLDLQLPVQSVHVTTNVVSSNPANGEVYNIM